MVFSVNNIPFYGNTGSISPINKQPINSIRIDLSSDTDRFESNNPSRYTTEFMINKLIAGNPKLQKMLSAADLEHSLNIKELNKLLDGHCRDTQNIAEGIVKNLPFALESKADLEAIKNAAYLHDIGKVFIPPEILNKNGRLNDTEKELVHKHSELGYELLKNSDLKPKVLHLIRNHHQNAKRSGYPYVDKNFFADLDLQILSLADKYSALTEERPYKNSLNRVQALTLIRTDVKSGKINPLVYNALVNYTDEIAMKNYAKAG